MNQHTHGDNGEESLPCADTARRETILAHYTAGAGATSTEPLAIVLYIKEQGVATVGGIFDTWIERMKARGLAVVGQRSQLRKELANAINRAQRHRLVSETAGELAITDRGRQYVIGAIHSRASTLKSTRGACSLEEVCAMCAEDELPGSVDGAGNYWSAPIGQGLARAMSSGWFQQRAPRASVSRRFLGQHAYG